MSRTGSLVFFSILLGGCFPAMTPAPAATPQSAQDHPEIIAACEQTSRNVVDGLAQITEPTYARESAAQIVAVHAEILQSQSTNCKPETLAPGRAALEAMQARLPTWDAEADTRRPAAQPHADEIKAGPRWRTLSSEVQRQAEQMNAICRYRAKGPSLARDCELAELDHKEASTQLRDYLLAERFDARDFFALGLWPNG